MSQLHKPETRLASVFEFVHTAPETSTTPRRFASAAERMGYDGVVVRNHLPPEGIDAATAEVPDDTEVGVYSGVEVRVEGGDVEGLHAGLRRAADAGVNVVAVHGGDEDLNRAAVGHEDVDLLAHPYGSGGGGDEPSFDHVLAREAAENGVAVELSLGPVLRGSGGGRQEALGGLRTTLGLTRKYGTQTVVSADPRSHLHLRAPREVRAVARLVGLTDDEVNSAFDASEQAVGGVS